MTTRALLESDLETVAEIERECFLEPWTTGMLSGSFSRTDFCGLLLEQDGEAVGYICGETLFENAEIARVAVKTAHRRKGHGERLLTAFENAVIARGASAVFLEVRAGNVAARSLYEKSGYFATRVRKRYYADGEDAVEMKKELKNGQP